MKGDEVKLPANYSLTDLRMLAVRYVREHEFLFDYIKEPLIQIVAQQFNVLAQVIGTTELICRRAETYGPTPERPAQ